ncbi:rolling circle replication-associated protein [Clostridium cagae]|uniref:rolling circle replication-associated protein n=1 Tax=Clostridium cagae TaxID=2080751 RepID=UPI003F7608BD
MNKKKIKRLYEDYDYEEIYDKKLTEDLRIDNNYVYIRQTIISGEVVESEMYPVWKCHNDVPRKRTGNESREAQKKLNKKNSRKNVVRLINANFNNGDLYITLTYKNGYLPDEKRARKDMRNYLARIKRWRKRNGITEPLKYIYSIGFENNPNSKKVRIHHHLIINSMDRNIIEELWGLGRASASKLQADDFKFEGVGRYIANQGPERIAYSKNLKKPIIRKDRTTLTRRKAENLALNENDYREFFEKKYKDCTYLDCSVYQSDKFPGVYFYARLRKKDVKRE